MYTSSDHSSEIVGQAAHQAELQNLPEDPFASVALRKALLRDALQALPAHPLVKFAHRRRVLTTTELLENILHQLIEDDNVFVSTISKQWRSTIQQSQTLQERLFHRFKKNNPAADHLHVNTMAFYDGLSTNIKDFLTPWGTTVRCRPADMSYPQDLFVHTTHLPLVPTTPSSTNQMIAKPLRQMILIDWDYPGRQERKEKKLPRRAARDSAWVFNFDGKGVTIGQIAEVFSLRNHVDVYLIAEVSYCKAWVPVKEMSMTDAAETFLEGRTTLIHAFEPDFSEEEDSDEDDDEDGDAEEEDGAEVAHDADGVSRLAGHVTMSLIGVDEPPESRFVFDGNPDDEEMEDFDGESGVAEYDEYGRDADLYS